MVNYPIDATPLNGELVPKRHFILLTLILLIKGIFLLATILYSVIGLGPDEAQYWTWSQQLDWGYYSKPPGIAWVIAAGSALFGNTEVGVRAAPLLIGFLLPYLIYALSRRSDLSPNASLWASIAMALSPIGFFSSFLAITDGGMVLFWTAACAYFAGKITAKEKGNAAMYLVVGALILCGALFKWPQYTFWIVVLASWWFFPFLASWHVVWGVALSLIALIPSVYWNMSHDWATFRHVSSTLSGGHAPAVKGVFSQGNPLEFLGSQAVLVSPILFILLIFGLWRLFRKRESPPALLFCGGVTIGLFFVGWLASLFMKIQGNWVIYAYPTAFPVIGWLASNGGKRIQRWTTAAILLSAILVCFVMAIPSLQSRGSSAGITIPYKMSPFRHNVGWERLAMGLREEGYRAGEDFLFADKYQAVSVLSFYGPKQQRVLFFNLQGTRKNQFSYWKGLDENEAGKRGFFVVIENTPQLNDPALVEKYEKQLKIYFDSVRFLGIKPLFEANGMVVKGMLIFECKGFLGKTPEDPALY